MSDFFEICARFTFALPGNPGLTSRRREARKNCFDPSDGNAAAQTFPEVSISVGEKSRTDVETSDDSSLICQSR